MTTQEQLCDAIRLAMFMKAEAQRLHDCIAEQGFLSAEQAADAEMMLHGASALEAEITALTGTIYGRQAPDPAICRHCKLPVHRQAGLWLHVSKDDFFKCGKLGIPEGEV
jgi:hypothetical protein